MSLFEAELPNQFSWLRFANQSSVRKPVLVAETFSQSVFFFSERGADEDRTVCQRGSKDSRKFSVRSYNSAGQKSTTVIVHCRAVNPDCRDALHPHCF